MADLPDYYTQTAISEAEAASFDGGLAANKSLTPVSRDIYYGTDNKILYICVVDGTWININALYLLVAGGTMTGAIAMGTNKITGLGDPTAAQDAATRAYVLARVALRLALTGGTMSGNIIMGGNKVTGLGAPLVQDQALRYNRAEIRNNEIAAAAGILVSKLVNTYFPETLMTAQGDILVRGASNPERLAKITTDQILQATATGYQGVALPTVGYAHLTVLGFQFNPATGDLSAVANVNDNNTTNSAYADALNEYAEIQLPSALHIKQFRQFGEADNDADGRWKLQYKDVEGNWQDWVTNIANRVIEDWGNWDSSGADVVATAIKLIATTLGTPSGRIYIHELEVKY